MRNITSSGLMSSRIVGILPPVCELTHPLIVDSEAGTLPKSSPCTWASKYFFVVSRNGCLKEKLFLYQTELAIWNVVVGSRPRSSPISPWYPASSCPTSPESRRSAVRIASNVEPDAPFIAMPSDIDALRGEMNTLFPASLFATRWNSANEKSLPEVATRCSEGSSVKDGGAWGPPTSEHAAAASVATTNTIRRSTFTRSSLAWASPA